MGMYQEIDAAPMAQLFALWESSEIPAWAADAWADDPDVAIADIRASLLDEIAYALAATQEGRSYLRPSFFAEDISQRCAALDALSQKMFVDNEIISALIAAFFAKEQRLRLTSLIRFCHIEQYPLPREVIEKVMGSMATRDIDALLPAWAMVYLSRAYPLEAHDILRRALTDPRPRLREFACDEAGDHDLIELADAILALRNDPVANVQEAAATNWHMLMGND
jgi:inhibitor of KinA sporulation pathway (predicted exonuclease)